MRWLVFSIVHLIFADRILMAQSGIETLPNGARSVGMGNANVTLWDVWGIFNNVGGLARIEHSEIAVGFDHRLALDELTTLSAAGVIKKNNAALGIGISSYGSEFFSQNQFGLGFSNQLGIASFGIKVNFFQTYIEGFGTGSAFIFEFGGIAELTPDLFFGAHIYNPGRARFGKNSPDFLPTVVKAGIAYKPSERVSLQLEAEKDILIDPLLKLGLEYNFFKKLWGRTGVNSLNSQLFFGLGFKGKTFHFDYSMTQHPALGYTHHFSTNIPFSKP